MKDLLQDFEIPDHIKGEIMDDKPRQDVWILRKATKVKKTFEQLNSLTIELG